MYYGKRLEATKGGSFSRAVARRRKRSHKRDRARRGLAATSAVLLVSTLAPASLLLAPQATAAPVGAGFQLDRADLEFILKQIKISERHIVTRTAENP